MVEEFEVFFFFSRAHSREKDRERIKAENMESAFTWSYVTQLSKRTDSPSLKYVMARRMKNA